MRVLTVAALPALLFPTLLTPQQPFNTQEVLSVEQPAPAARLLSTQQSQPAAPVAAAQLETVERVEAGIVKAIVETVDASPFSEQDVQCLALNIYHEARSEPESGQIAVARVTLNRVASNAFPGSICAVVKQGGEKRNRCQFSWWCDNRSDTPKNKKAWRRSLEIARRAIDAADPDPTHGALYYHASYTKPSWSRVYKRTTRIGRHLFYRPKSI